MENREFLLCERILVDAGTNNCTVINLIEDIRGATLPFALPLLTVFWVKNRTPDEPAHTEGALEIRDPLGVVNRFPVAVDFGDSLGNRSIVTFQGFVFQHAGDYVFTFTIPGQITASKTLHITHAPVAVEAPRPAEANVAVGANPH